MTRPAAPSLPTARQIREAVKAVLDVCPDARVARVGPEGVTFRYPDEAGEPREVTTWGGSFG